MWRHIRVAFVPALSLFVALAGISYGLTGSVVPVTPDNQVGEIVSNSQDEEILEVAAQEEENEEGDDAAPAKTPKARSTEGCPDGFEGTHGDYVSSTDDKPRREAAHADCGKPVNKEKGEKDKPAKPEKKAKKAKKTRD